MAVGSIIGGLFGGISSLIQAQSANKIADKQIAAQREENEKTRQYNRELAEWQNSENIAQWQRENEYNLPENVKQRYKDAGLNPDLLYGEGASGIGLSANSPDLTSGAPASPTDLTPMARKTSTYGQMLQGLVQGAMAGEQIRKVSKEATKTDKETENVVVQGQILSADALTRAAQNEVSIEIGKSTVYVNHSVASLNHKQQEKIASEITKINGEYEQIRQDILESQARVRNIDSQIVQRRFEAYLKSNQFDLEVNKFMQMARESDSRISLNYQTVKDMMATQAARIYSLNAGAAVNEYAANKLAAELGIVSITAESLQFSLDQMKEYASALSTAQIVSMYLSSLGSVLSGAGSAMSGFGMRHGSTVNKTYNTQGSVYVAPSN